MTTTTTTIIVINRNLTDATLWTIRVGRLAAAVVVLVVWRWLVMG